MIKWKVVRQKLDFDSATIVTSFRCSKYIEPGILVLYAALFIKYKVDAALQ